MRGRKRGQPQQKSSVIAQVQDRRLRTVILRQKGMDHIVEQHDELDGHELMIMRAVETADRRHEGNFPGAEVLVAEGLGPARYFCVVVAYKGVQGEILTAHPDTDGPKTAELL